MTCNTTSAGIVSTVTALGRILFLAVGVARLAIVAVARIVHASLAADTCIASVVVLQLIAAAMVHGSRASSVPVVILAVGNVAAGTAFGALIALPPVLLVSL